jgi:hypothetical protein
MGNGEIIRMPGLPTVAEPAAVVLGPTTLTVGSVDTKLEAAGLTVTY